MLAEVLAAMRVVRHGYIQFTVQDARVIQIDRTEKHRIVFALAVILLAVAVACGSGGRASTGEGGQRPTATTQTSTAPSQEKVTLRLGYFPNVTHSQPLVGLARGTFVEELGPSVKLETKTFNAGPSVIEALFAGEIDASYIGPNPAINGYVKSGGEALRIVAGATSGGALLIVRADRGIEKPANLEDKKIATPQLGNTQDVALRAYLLANGLAARESGGNVNVIPTANPDILTLFQKGDIDGAWVPEPWATRLIREAGGKVYLDERDLWPNGDFVTTQLIVRTAFLEDHPDVVKRLLAAHVDVTQWINDNSDEAKLLVNQSIGEVTGKSLPQEVIDAAWPNLRITYDPIASSLRKSASDAFELGFLGDKEPDLSGIYDLEILNEVLQEKGLPSVRE